MNENTYAISNTMPLGKHSLLSGCISAILIPTAAQLSTHRWSGSNFTLKIADHWGLLREPSSELINFWSSPGLLAMHDEKALSIFSALGVTLALAAIILAIWAEYKQEASLYLSVGFISGSSSLVFLDTHFGMFALLIGTGAIITVRHLFKPKCRRAHAAWPAGSTMPIILFISRFAGLTLVLFDWLIFSLLGLGTSWWRLAGTFIGGALIWLSTTKDSKNK